MGLGKGGGWMGLVSSWNGGVLVFRGENGWQGTGVVGKLLYREEGGDAENVPGF